MRDTFIIGHVLPGLHQRDDLRLPRAMGAPSGAQQPALPARERHKLPEETHCGTFTF